MQARVESNVGALHCREKMADSCTPVYSCAGAPSLRT